MIRISIYCSEIYSGEGDFIGHSNLNSYNEFLDFAKNSWLKCNITSDTHECAATATAMNAPEGFPEGFGLGLFVFHYNKRKGEHEIYISHTSKEEYIEDFEKVGMSEGFQNHLSEEELFLARFEFLQNLNNLHRLLGTWIQKIDDDYDLYELLENEKNIPDASDELVANSLLSTVLRFAKTHRKAMETLQWLVSNEGQAFLDNFDTYDTVADKIAKAAISLFNEIKESSDSDLQIHEFISRFESTSIPEPVLF